MVKKILIVDDSRIVLDDLKDLLEGLYKDHKILTSENGNDALDKVVKHVPDVVLLDINMPDIDGFEVCRRIRTNTDLPYIPVVFLTGKETDIDSRIKGFSIGADDFISKPVGISELHARLNSALRIKELQDKLLKKKKLLEHEVKERTVALSKSESRYKAIVDNIPAFICRFLPENYRFTFVNNSFCDYFGLSRKKLLAQSFYDLVSEAEYNQLVLSVRLLTKNNPYRTYERMINTPKGKRWQRWTDQAIFDEKDNIIEFQSIGEDITDSKNAEVELNRSKVLLQALSSHLLTVREEERKIIAREIHDELGQNLTAIKMDIYWLSKRFTNEQKSLLERLYSMIKLVDSTIESVQRISSELRPRMLDELGFLEAIDWQIKEFQKHTGIKCRVTSMPSAVVIDQERSIAVFRILQELLTNISRHANAKKVIINLIIENENLILVVTDNGIGIKDDAVYTSNSLGILGIRERANHFGGQITIEGRPSKGTRVKLIIPMK
jgi:two-component system, NarL family, sensor histidine kinase UhpB